MVRLAGNDRRKREAEESGRREAEEILCSREASSLEQGRIISTNKEFYNGASRWRTLVLATKLVRSEDETSDGNFIASVVHTQRDAG